MAAKMNMSKLLQEIRGFAELSNRRPQPRSPGLWLTQIRSRRPQAALPKRKLGIRIETQDRTAIPDRVKINYLKPGPGPIATHPAP
jgi:hypothetical protein